MSVCHDEERVSDRHIVCCGLVVCEWMEWVSRWRVLSLVSDGIRESSASPPVVSLTHRLAHHPPSLLSPDRRSAGPSDHLTIS